jgi:CheY-like chemotaxis protein
MSIAKAVSPEVASLRRYARALTGSQRSGDRFVAVTLEALLADSAALDHRLPPRLGLYRAFNLIWASAAVIPDGEEVAPLAAKAQERMKTLTPPARQALLLTTIEGFTLEQAGKIMGLSAERIGDLVQEARDTIAGETQARVLIVEDEMLIGLDLQDIVERLGHDVIGVTATASEAIAAAREERPDLILADIQLADGSSGIDAVKQILSEMNCPVIFITSFPDRLLTGERPEPTFLINKPFSEQTVAAAVSQALFFESTPEDPRT